MPSHYARSQPLDEQSLEFRIICSKKQKKEKDKTFQKKIQNRKSQ